MIRRTIRPVVTIVLVLGLAAPVAWSAHLDHTVSFDESDLVVTERDGYDVITLRGCDLTRDIGLPQLPVLPLTLALPTGARVVGIEILEAESSERVVKLRPMPGQHPRILPVPGLDIPFHPFVEADPSVYGGKRPYPASIAELRSAGHLGDARLVGVAVHPVQFLPSVGKLRFFGSISIRLHLDLAEQDTPRTHLPDQSKVVRILSGNNDAGRLTADRRRLSDTRLQAGDFEHVVILGNTAFEEAFTPLAAWKTAKGVPSTMVSVTWITANYPGDDDPERIRNFVADAHNTWGSVWFLLAGDTNWVPTRHAYAMTCEAGGHAEEDNIGCDMYFADLDGTWNADGDEIYGELADDVDLYPEVFVGRAPIRTIDDASAFVEKVVNYEHAQFDDFQLDMLMAAEVLWTDPFTDSGIALDRIDREHVPPRYDPITKLYETLGNETGESVKQALNSGPGHFLHSGHAWYTVMGCGGGDLYRWDVVELANGHRQPLVYSIGCWPAAFDLPEDCIAERFLQNPGGGAVAFIGNSRYGWASPGNPGYGYSERFMQEFYRVLFVERITSAGAALAAAKAAFVPFSQAENVYRWHQYQLNLLGDPEMPVWTAAPTPLAVVHPDSVTPGPSVLGVSVRTSGGPLEGALVCASNGSDVYERGITSSDGSVSLSVDTVLPDSLTITVTADERLPYQSRIPVVFSGAFMRAVGVEVNDAGASNRDGVAGPGETVDVSVELRNFGTDEAPAVEATLYATDAMVGVLADQSYYGDVPGGAVAAGTSSYVVTISPDCPNGHVAVLDVIITSGGTGATWTGSVAFTVGAPVLQTVSYSFDDTWGGDGDGTAEPGESVRLLVEVRNSGLADALSPSFTLSTDDTPVDVTSPIAALPEIPSDDSGSLVFELLVSSECPVPAFPLLVLDAVTSDGLCLSDTLRVTVGSSGSYYDFESGPSEWTQGGPSNIWALTDHRTHSGTASWYAGTQGVWQYPDNADAWLDSPEFVRGAGAELSFWCWYEFPIYHEDGFYVEVLSSGVAIDTLDFIGSGGALDMLGSVGNDWLEYRYRLPGTVGDTLHIRFRLTTDDAEVAEGVYVDDVSVVMADAPAGTGVEGAQDEGPMLFLHQNHPNPFSPSTLISFSLLTAGNVELTLYNIQGRLIRTLAEETRQAGEYEVAWDGTDEFGVDVAAGMYLYRLRLGEQEETRKMILVR
ncbi:MAG: C25 family cysteine peptidase [Candidatus Eisenbacteria bacterium]